MDKEYRVTSLEYVYLGRSGENLARTVKIDVSEWLDRWPGASIHILHRPKGSEDYYIADTTLEGGMLTWVIRAADVAAPGRGRLEIRATEGETIKKSMIGVSIVDASLTGNETKPPDPQKPWVDSVLAAAATVETSAERAEQAADRAEQASAKGVLTVNGIGPDENGNVDIKIGNGLKLSDDGAIVVDTANAVEQDNTLPVTSAAVQTTVGNIEILLKTI